MDNDNLLISILVGQGYDEESATKVVNDVLAARRKAREDAMKKYVGKRSRIDVGGMLFEVVIHDVKMDYAGKLQWQVSPLNGSKMAWVEKLVTQ